MQNVRAVQQSLPHLMLELNTLDQLLAIEKKHPLAQKSLNPLSSILLELLWGLLQIRTSRRSVGRADQPFDGGSHGGSHGGSYESHASGYAFKFVLTVRS